MRITQARPPQKIPHNRYSPTGTAQPAGWGFWGKKKSWTEPCINANGGERLGGGALEQEAKETLGLPSGAGASWEPEPSLKEVLWAVDTFGQESFTPFFAIERAPRVPTRPPQAWSPPRSLLAKMLYYKDKVIIMRRAREIGNILYNGTRVSIYPDFSPDLQKRRAKFREKKTQIISTECNIWIFVPGKTEGDWSWGDCFF